MQLKLHCISHQYIDDLVIEKQPLLIGRDAVPYSQYPHSMIAGLSRKHAKIFEQSGSFHIADLGSQNGTLLNENEVDVNAIRIHSGDQLCIAKEITYNVEIQNTLDETLPEASLSLTQLTLEPCDTSERFPVIEITDFPFPVGKSHDPFKQLDQVNKAAVMYMSRNHACFINKGKNIFLKDLNSTNGTYLNGCQLSTKEIRLRDGDQIYFGDKQQVYRIKIINITSQDKSIRHPQQTLNKTTFISKADFFLDIYCANQSVNEDNDLHADEQTAKNTNLLKNDENKSSWLKSRSFIFMRELYGAFFDSKKTSPLMACVVSVLVVICIAVSAGLYYKGNKERIIKTLISEGKYQQGAKLANDYLWYHSRDNQMIALSTEAVLKLLMPVWMTHIETQQYRQSQQQLIKISELSQNNSALLAMLELLEWIGKFKAFMVSRGGFEAPIVMFKHETPINELLKWWEDDTNQHLNFLNIIQRYATGFDAFHRQVVSDVRQLTSERAIYITAITKLKNKLEEKLTGQLSQSDQQQIRSDITSFINRYPKIHGTKTLLADLDLYQGYRMAFVQHDLDTVLLLQQQESMQTPLFGRHFEQRIALALPADDVVAKYKLAKESWSNGNFSDAIGLLDNIEASHESQYIAVELMRLQTIHRDYKNLQLIKGHKNYGEHLVKFYNGLDHHKDSFLVKLLLSDVEQQKPKLAEAMEIDFKAAKKSWGKYKKNGSIRGKHRLEAKISKTYSKQASLLAKANEKVTQGMVIYELLHIKNNQQRLSLYHDINDEIVRQRKWIKDLNIVLEPELINKKLNFLADNTR